MCADAGEMELYNKSMYGTRHAASNWECDGQEHVKSCGFLGRLQRDSKIIKRRRDIARQSRPEGIHTQAKYHRKELQRQS